MQCPACQTDLKMADRQGVEIDYCPRCRGVWLDRGELDKIIERAAQRSSFTGFEGRRHGYEGDERRDRRWDDDDDEHDLYKRRRRKSFLGELFDF
ncbi:MAG TPA: zf-TFIIB domain-containing protein [Alphaproteobacteria bacterium]|nr:zf-TFIIB domain-containing protein [Alphaproteobacteria bacterium]